MDKNYCVYSVVMSVGISGSDGKTVSKEVNMERVRRTFFSAEPITPLMLFHLYSQLEPAVIPSHTDWTRFYLIEEEAFLQKTSEFLKSSLRSISKREYGPFMTEIKAEKEKKTVEENISFLLCRISIIPYWMDARTFVQIMEIMGLERPGEWSYTGKSSRVEAEISVLKRAAYDVSMVESNAKEIEEALDNVLNNDDYDIEKTSGAMAGLLMDDSISSYGMFEDLASEYTHGSDEFRRGMDRACGIMLEKDMKALAEYVLEMF